MTNRVVLIPSPSGSLAILKAMNAVHAALSHHGIGKLRTNEHQKYKFRGIDDCYNAVSGPMADSKVIPIPSYTDVVQQEREGKDGKIIFVTRLLGTFTFVSCEDGSMIVAGPFAGEAMDNGDKSTNKAESAAFKYALMQVFTIPTEGDNDADATTHEPAPSKNSNAGGTSSVRTPEGAKSSDASPPAAGKTKERPDPTGLWKQLEEKLKLYGKKRPAYEVKVAEALGVPDLASLRDERLPEALATVIKHQKAAKARSQKHKDAPTDDLGDIADRGIDTDGDDGIPV